MEVKTDISRNEKDNKKLNPTEKVIVQEVDTAVINAATGEELTQPKRRQRPRKKGRAVAGQISRLKMAVLCLIPLVLLAFWTELAPWLASLGMRHCLVDLPGKFQTVDVRGLLQLLLLAPILYAGRQFYTQAWEDLQEWIPSAEVLLLIGTAAALTGGIYTAVQLIQGVPYPVLPPLFLAYIGLCVSAALFSVYLDRWCKAPLPQFLDMPAMWLVSGSVLLVIITCLSFFYTGRATVPVWQIAMSVFIISCPVFLLLAPSTAAFTAVTKAAEQQILLRDGTILGDAGETTLVIFDKTGTLTIGRPVLTDIHIFNNGSESGLLSLAAAMLQDSNLPGCGGRLQTSALYRNSGNAGRLAQRPLFSGKHPLRFTGIRAAVCPHPNGNETLCGTAFRCGQNRVVPERRPNPVCNLRFFR